MSENKKPARSTSQPPLPGPVSFLFAAVFGIAMLFNLYMDRSPMVSMFLGSATLLILGFDVGRITGKK